MRQIENMDEIYEFCSALGSNVRFQIVKLLHKKGQLNMDSIAKELFLTNGAITSHIKKLSDCGIIKVTNSSGKRGSQKECALNVDKVLMSISDVPTNMQRVYEFDVNVGQYSNYNVLPTCGLVTEEHIIGELDEVKYFGYPERINAQLLWFTEGYLEYHIPNPLKIDETLSDLQISFEMASEAPGFSEHYPSDIYFWINNLECGYWTCPGEFNDRAGILNPDWWFPNLGQYGRLKMLSINENGTFIDGLKTSNKTIKDLAIKSGVSVSFKIAVPSFAKNKGGLTLFGKKFGDYAQGIKVRLFVSE